MDLLEYQAKELFREMGIPVLPSQRIDHPSDLKGLRIPYPIALKSQVRSGGRGKAGGVKFVENTIDAVAAAQTIFHLPIMGEYPQVLLAESKYNVDREFYLAVILDRNTRRPILLGSVQGGIDAEATLEKIQQVVVDRLFTSFYARRLAVKMGLKGELIQVVSGIVEKMYRLFVEKDLDLVEINPLGISTTGEVMALDGKISANDEALSRHPELTNLIFKDTKPVKGRDDGISSKPISPPLNFVQLEGNIAIVCNGAGLTMATLDLVYFGEGKPANFLNLGGEVCWNTTAELLSQHFEEGLELVTQDKRVKVVLVNIVGSMSSCEALAGVIEQYFKRREGTVRPKHLPSFVVRLIGSDWEQAKQRLSTLKVSWVENLEEAVSKAVDLARKG